MLTLTAWSLVGCYAYVPVITPAVVSPGAVRISLNSAGTEYFKQSLGTNILEIGGVVIRSTPDTIIVQIDQTITTRQERFDSQGQTLAVPLALTEEVSRRTYSRRRSVALGASILAVVVAVVTAKTGASSGFSGTPTGGGPQP